MLQYEELRLRLINHEKTLDDLSEALGLDKMKKSRLLTAFGMI